MRFTDVGSAGEFDEFATRVQRILRRQRDDVKSVFRKIDTDGSGLIDFREFMRAMKELRIDLTEDEGHQLFRRFDLDDSGEISYREFISFVDGKKGIASDAPEPRSSSRMSRSSRRD